MQLAYDHYRVQTDPSTGKPVILGRGGMGITFKAVDTVLGREVALKVINSAQLNSEEAHKRFLREASATARLHHRNIATIYHQGRIDEGVYYAMEFIEGVTVGQLIRKDGPLPLADALDITRQVVQALSEAEKHGLVHRDIKPANIMLKTEADGQRVAKLIDFGLAKFTRGDHGEPELTQAGGYLGTVATSSPEQCRGEPLDTRSDIYSLGVTLWIMVTGEPPFKDPNPLNAMMSHLNDTPPFDKLNAFPPCVQDLIKSMLQKKKAERPRDTATLLHALDACIALLPSPADEFRTMATMVTTPTGRAAPAAPPVKRRPRLVPALLILPALLAAGAGWWYLRGPSAPARSATASPPIPKQDAAAPPSVPAPPPPSTAASVAAMARAQLERLDAGGFVESFVQVHGQFGETPEGSNELEDLRARFEEARRARGDVLATWARDNVSTLLTAAKAGLPSAHLLLGDGFREVDAARAADFYRRAVAEAQERNDIARELEAWSRAASLPGQPVQGDAVARIGQLIEETGRVDAPMFAASRPWIETFAGMNWTEALLVLGRRLEQDEPEKAAASLRQAALQFDRDEQWPAAVETYVRMATRFPDSSDASFARSRLQQLGVQLRDGEVVLSADTYDGMEPLLLQAAHLPTASLLEFLGERALRDNPSLALHHFTKAAEAGSPQAMAQVGLMLRKGIGDQPDPARAAAWFRKAAALNDRLGYYFLALALLDGAGVERNAPEAIDLLERSAGMGYAPAVDKLADCYRRGIGVRTNYVRALELYDKAIGMRHLDALGNKGVMLMNGEGAPRNETQAVKLFEDGALQDNPWCMYLYGAALWHGTGTSKDRETAERYLRRAADAGIAAAHAFLNQAANAVP
jgi:TPR repeat protein/tRNA A-37 threonylcarbamoyl transferase component Bud32